jgi:hypothetical protein
MDKAGKSAEQILDAFVAEYGEKALMAPKPEGFNLWGYLLPGSLIVVAGAGLVAFISRRRTAVAGADTVDPGVPGARGPDDLTTPAGASPEEMERLRRALAEVED